MAKKTGKILTLVAVVGAAAAGISYFRKYRSFNRELDEDFRDFEEEEDSPAPDSTMNRNYVSLHADKDEFLVAAGDVLNAVKDAAGAAKNVVKDAAAIMTDTARDAMNAAADTAAAAKATFTGAGTTAAEKAEDMAEDILEETANAVEDAAGKIVEKTEEAKEKISETATIIEEELPGN